MVKRRRLQCIFSNLLSKWKVSSEGGKVGIKLFGHLVGTYRGGGQIGYKFQRNWVLFMFLIAFLFYEGKKIKLRF